MPSRSQSFELLQPATMMSCMDKFVKSVNNMTDVILVPSTLMDVTAETTNCKNAKVVMPTSLEKSDMYDVYNMLKEVKDDVVNMVNCKDSEMSHRQSIPSLPESRRVSFVNGEPFIHAMKKDSFCDNSDTDSVLDDGSIETSSTTSSSGIESDAGNPDKIASDFRFHLHGLHNCLEQLTDAAEAVTEHYQHGFGTS